MGKFHVMPYPSVLFCVLLCGFDVESENPGQLSAPLFYPAGSQGLTCFKNKITE